uniref:Uncharacterized protein n=1 Tax=Panagrolaimus superbus TaxID=310955 RepID=A0A914Y6Y0_9BILA
MNPSKQQQHQTSSSSKKQSSSSQHGVKTNSLPSTPNSRQPNQSQGRRPQQQQQVGAQSNKKRNSPSYSNQMEFLSFQPALQGCFQSPQQQYDNKRRSSPRGGNYGNVVSQSAKYSSQVNGYNNSLSPIKLASPAIAPIIRQGNNQQQSNSARRQRGSPLALFKHTPFAGAKYLELPSTKDLPLPPAWMIDGTPAPVSSTETSLSSSPTSMIEPPSPTTEAAIKVAKENGFDGRVRIHPLQLIAAVSSC